MSLTWFNGLIGLILFISESLSVVAASEEKTGVNLGVLTLGKPGPTKYPPVLQ